jgi:HEAT repeats
MMTTDAERIRTALEEAGVAGSHDFGHFVNDPGHLGPSTFDERGALPVLIAILPTLEDVRAIRATVRHLGRPFARPAAFESLHETFVRWSPQHDSLGWTIGDSLAIAATIKQLPTLLTLASDDRFGTSRQMIVNSLWRFKKDSRVEDALIRLIEDRDVCRHAMSALRRTVGNGEAMRELYRVRDNSSDQVIRKRAQEAINQCEVAIDREMKGSGRHGLGPLAW